MHRAIRVRRLARGRRPRPLRAMATMISNDQFQIWSHDAKPAWAQVWHLWTVIIPRRTISGQFVYGKVWRRHDGRGWERGFQFLDWRIRWMLVRAKCNQRNTIAGVALFLQQIIATVH